MDDEQGTSIAMHNIRGATRTLRTPSRQRVLVGRIAWTISTFLVAAVLTVLALIPALPESYQFIPLIVARFEDPDDFLDSLTVGCGDLMIDEGVPETTPQLFGNRLIDELTMIELQPTVPVPPEEPRWRLRERDRRYSTVRERRQHPPRGARNTSAGPSDASEAAVDAALAWLAAHQHGDGSWSFDLRDGPCDGRCGNSGDLKDARNAATGLALLVFLGAGETHLEGRYQDVVDRGLRFLVASQKFAGATGSWHEAPGTSGNYSHAIATIAVCDALQFAREAPTSLEPIKPMYEMTEAERRTWQDAVERAKRRPAEAIDKRRLADAAQAAIHYLVVGQHKSGGWRHDNGQEGDTTVTGWALAALKSGHLAKLKVPVITVMGAARFLDSVQEGDYGSTYHYMQDKNRPLDAIKATSATGLLCRMYLGWDKNHPGIGEGVRRLSHWRPSTGPPTDAYYNYHATQVMYFFGADHWREWNYVMRDYLVATQAKEGHERGSWHFTGDHGTTAGGRLYGTTLAAMTLEVYYRYLPIYRDRSVEDDLQGE